MIPVIPHPLSPEQRWESQPLGHLLFLHLLVRALRLPNHKFTNLWSCQHLLRFLSLTLPT